ncbi:MAG TPA: SDR family NAD(P)-dependent oxidoreductase [Methylomusa anaerophila]|nr:SDR family NAD(P)-dependent oxidoreductase [Methylomusa anaerophila]HML90355.1 SDR family NAD(P)-dependent oxidoreductase [Methylomusa anaerophila]
MEERLGVIVESVRELADKLQAFAAGREGVADLYRGQAKRDRETLAKFAADEDMANIIDVWIGKGKYEKILDFWVKGLSLDWDKLYGDVRPSRISLPTYPFAKERYWVGKPDSKADNTAMLTTALHPLLHQNTSDLSGQRFTSTFTGREFFLADHGMTGRRVLPAVACLEMARAAVERAAGVPGERETGIRLKQVVWDRPITVEERPGPVHISLFPGDNGEIAYEIYSESGEVDTELIIHSQGTAALSSAKEVPALDLRALQAQCNQSILSAGQGCEGPQVMEPDHGPECGTFEKVYVGPDQVLAKLCLPAYVPETQGQFVLHPGLMGAALQALTNFMTGAGDGKTLLPLALRELEIFSHDVPAAWAVIRRSADGAADGRGRFDIDLCGEQGNVCVRMKGFSFRVPAGEAGLQEFSQTHGQPSREPLPPVEPEPLREKTLHQLKGVLGEVTKLGLGQIDADEPLEAYGIDSLMITRLNQKLAAVFGELSKTLFYEYQTLAALAEYLSTNHPQACRQWTGLEEPGASLPAAESAPGLPGAGQVPVLTSLAGKTKTRKKKVWGFAVTAPGRESREPIAIIGISGRYPQAGTLREYWENLQNGRDCITEIPNERWPLEGFYLPDSQAAPAQGRSYSKWGGFVTGFAEFDPLFFNMSPREALNMDPQERLFIESCWEALEDAGYTREQLAVTCNRRVGVFAGITKTGFNLYGPELWKQGEQIFPYTSFSSVANRISYLFNLQGPSMPVDTMCSSSLTAIHEACEHLYRGECEMAIAGGVNLYLHPSSYVGLCGQQMLSASGQCQSFGQGGDGFVPGEGVGAVILKPLARAIADGDRIYALIRGTGINHGGKTNGYTVPNPKAQGELIRATLDKAGVNARAVSYIEAHGTGTKLGDPIEITGLTQAFRQDTQDTGYCAIGSVKSNIGHGEAAAGIAGITKIVLQMQQQKLVPSLHARELNPNINFAQTPFVVQQELGEWKRPVVESNGESREYPRIAGISSFGAGGANAHVVLEEYRGAERPVIEITPRKPAVIVLSAKDKERLQEQARQLLAAIQERPLTDGDLADMAYTLQVGREAMEERLGLVAGSMEEAARKLGAFLAGQDGREDLYQGQVKANRGMLDSMTADEDMMKTVETWVAKGKYAKILDLWVKGLNVDWHKLYGETKPRRISLPTYPFARERYWLPAIDTKAGGALTAPTIETVLHPLVQRNTSTFSGQRFSSTFTGQEFFLADHIIKGRRVLPGAAYLEMARAAVEQAVEDFQPGRTGIRLQNVVWVRPLAVGEQPVPVHISLYPEDNGEIAYEIYSEPENADAEPIVHSQGSAALSPLAAVPVRDIKVLQAQCSESILVAGECYEAFRAMGIDYGPGHRGIEMVYAGQEQVLAKLSLPAAVMDTKDRFILHPGLLDSALQASLGLVMAAGDKRGKVPPQPALPFALQELAIFGACPAVMWALVRYSEGSKAEDRVPSLDIDLCDEQGNVCVKLKGFIARILESEADSAGTLLLSPSWQEATGEGTVAPDYAGHLVILCESDKISREIQEILEAQTNGVRCLTLESGQKGLKERFQACAVQAFAQIQRILTAKPQGNVLVQIVVGSRDEQRLFAGLAGLLKTARLENPKLIGQLIEIEPGEGPAAIIAKLEANSRSPNDSHIRYQDGQRLLAGWSEVEVSQAAVSLPWKDQGVYLITGGAGGLGLIFAAEIAHKTKDAALILTGRSPLSEEKQGKLKELAALGARVAYRQADVADRQAVAGLIKSIKGEFGDIHGIIHSAGIIRDNFIIKKTREQFLEVLVPKVAGLVNLDEAGRDLNLDFFIVFSSLAGSFGNIGQADYAAANAFMDAYVRYRNALVAENQRRGRTLSINWPLWQEGGMHVDTERAKLMQQTTGMVAMQTAAGIQALYQGFAAGKEQVLVMEGNVMQLRNFMGLKSNSISNSNSMAFGEFGNVMAKDEAAEFNGDSYDFYLRLAARISNGEVSDAEVERIVLALN